MELSCLSTTQAISGANHLVVLIAPLIAWVVQFTQQLVKCTTRVQWCRCTCGVDVGCLII
jgi:hypothetical protein